MKPENQSRYADLLADPSDEALGRLVQELDAAYTTPARPADLSWVSAQPYLTQVSRAASNEESPLTPVRPLRWHAMRDRKGAFLAVAAVVVTVMLSTALLKMLGTLRFQQNPQTPTSLAADVQLLQQLVQSKGTPPNIQQLLQSGQFTPLNLTSHTSDVHIQEVYADANNVVLLYTIDQRVWNTAGGPTLTLKTSTGQTLPETAERGDMGKEPVFKNKLVALLAYYDVSVIPGNPTQLTLTATLARRISPSREKIGEFTIAVHSDKKVINVHQTTSSHGHALTLERVVITPSETRFYYSYQGSLASSTDSFTDFGDETLSIAGKPYGTNPFPVDNSGDTYGWFNVGSPNYTSFHETFLGQTGTWVYTEHADVDVHPSTVSGYVIHYTWTFTFTVS